MDLLTKVHEATDALAGVIMHFTEPQRARLLPVLRLLLGLERALAAASKRGRS